MECEESRCIMSRYYGLDKETIEQRKEEAKYQKKQKDEHNLKFKIWYKAEREYWTEFKDRERKLVNYDRKPHMNKSDWRHDDNWFLAIQKLGELMEKYYSNLKY